ncbi:helix-turn-helix domain-containing protein [Priestia megaterium]|uniref:winged helix-turn-helix transcriptional regulator n=1 Tax=Priestia megaterium TaxID=1404 RepID=UPI002E1A2CDD|nr:helix-turn-helix domain-containing protein [Priestia megaterium]MED4268374.1 helix-turn-helix domain-containing protein [Priestia megaterium]MED4279265.1 helix-turn-helix domain-containing protein [Priestia megaterium]MED4314655.1 helix-turn-helix domain-containing protein [Priestia megaterium]
MKTPDQLFSCPIEAATKFIGGKYKTIILWHLVNETLRFSEIQRLVPKATPKMLTQQLRELESDGLIKRVVYPVVPPKTEYSMTTLGKSLIPILEALRNWGAFYYEELGIPNPCIQEDNA